MTTYSSEAINGVNFLMKRWLTGIAFLGSYPLFLYIFPGVLPIAPGHAWMHFAIIAGAATLRLINTEYTSSITIDSVKRQVTVERYLLMAGHFREHFAFDNLRIEPEYGWLINRSKIRRIILYEGTEKRYTLSAITDGFSRQSMKEMADHFNSLTHPA